MLLNGLQMFFSLGQEKSKEIKQVTLVYQTYDNNTTTCFIQQWTLV